MNHKTERDEALAKWQRECEGASVPVTPMMRHAYRDGWDDAIAGQSAGVPDEPKRGTDAQILFERKLTCEAINGAIAFGHQNTNAPPSDDHWLAPYWRIGRKQAELEAALASRPDAQADERGAFEAWWKDISPSNFDYASALAGYLARAAAPRDARGVLEGWKLVPVERSYDMRAKAIIAFNAADHSGQDRDDALNAAYQAELAAAPSPDREQVGEADSFVQVPQGLTREEKRQLILDHAEASPSRECGEKQECPHGVDDGACKQCYGEAVRGEQGAAYRYIVIGYGETDYPQAKLVATHDELLDAVLGMMYTKPSDADAEIREAYRKDIDDEDEWCGNVWRTEFEIGGITIYDLGGEIPRPIAASAPTLEPVHGDVLPPIGEQVQIHLASADVWEPHTVVGYYVWPDLRGDSFLQRVFVRVRHSDGAMNARMLRDIRRPDGSHYVKPTVKLPAPQPQAAEPKGMTADEYTRKFEALCGAWCVNEAERKTAKLFWLEARALLAKERDGNEK